MLVDPRPYTYQFRKPRYSNPTFQSRNLYESLYHRYPYQSNDYFTQRSAQQYQSHEKMPKIQHQQDYVQLQRNIQNYKQSSRPINVSNKNEEVYINPQRNQQSYKLPAINRISEQKKNSYNSQPAGLINNANKSQMPIQKRRGFERFKIYERQQKPFDIINCFPRQNQANKLRNYPKLTLQHRLIENGSYHSFDNQQL